MELDKKLAILADGAKYDASCASSGAVRGYVTVMPRTVAAFHY